MQPKNQDYDYTTSGFNDFLSRSIDGGIGQAQAAPVRQVNFDQSQISGSLGDHLRIGSIDLDGTTGRISIFDENENEVVRIGDLG